MAYETFDPVTAGWKLQRGYRLSPQWQVAEDQRELGNISSTAISERKTRTVKYRMICESFAAWEYLESFFRRLVGQAGRFYWAWPQPVPSPDKAPTLESVVSGSQAQRTITVCYAWKNSAGTTRPSPTGSLLVPANSLIKVTLPSFPSNVPDAVIYAAQDDAGNEEQQTILNYTLTWTQPDAALLTGTADPPSANTATETPLCKLGQGGYQVIRQIGTFHEVEIDIQEVYS